MGVPVYLDHQPGRQAHEVGDVTAQNMLAAELETSKPSCPKHLPHQLFGVGLVSPQLTCQLGHHRIAPHRIIVSAIGGEANALYTRVCPDN